MTTTITTLMENTPSYHKQMQVEHGLSFYIDTGDLKFIFDCGASPNFLANAARLDLDLSDASFVVCSHGHWDHTGGFRPLVERVGVRRLVTGRGFFEKKYALDGFRHTYLGLDFDKRFLAANAIDHHECGDLTRLGDECWLIGNFERTVPEETIPMRFVIDKDGEYRPDPFAEEVCLAVPMDDGLAVVVGCSHPGILNILRTVRKRLDKPIRGVWGGTHLEKVPDDRIAVTLREFKKMGVRHLGLTHCSGDRILEAIDADPDLLGCRLRTGDGVTLTAKKR